MGISSKYYFLLRDYKNLKRNYSNLSIEEKLRCLKLELLVEDKNIKVGNETFKSKSEKKKEKINSNKRKGSNMNVK